MKMKEVTEQTGLTERTVRYYIKGADSAAWPMAKRKGIYRI